MKGKTMSNYNNGKIYKIISSQTDSIYIGSTISKYLCDRLSNHRYKYRQYLDGKNHYVTSFEIIQYGDAKIILLENYPCKDKNELLAREQYYIDQNRANVVNQHKAFTGLNDYEYFKQYREEHKDYILVKKKQYRQDNKYIIAEHKKKYYDANKEVISEKMKKYREAHKDVINAQRRMKHVCACGDITNSSHRARHERSTRHQMLMQLKQDNPTAENI